MADPSEWAYGALTLTAAAHTDSLWSYGSLELSPAAPQKIDSAWAYGSVSLRNPHLPIGVYDGSSVVRLPILVWDGASFS